MSKKTASKRNRNLKKTKKLDGIQIAGIGVILVIAVSAVWMFAANRKPASTASIPTLAVPQNTAQATQATSNQSAQAPQATSKQYASEPPMTIDIKKQYFATVKMAKGGEFVIQLYADKAPRTVNSFVFLARDGYFNGVTFHRVLEGFMAQGGDPTGSGSGGPGYEFVYEGNDLKFDKAGVVAMANTGPATPTNGSQFFITFGPTAQLDGGYTIFGEVISGMEVVNGLTRRDPQQNPTFPGDAMENVTITEK